MTKEELALKIKSVTEKYEKGEISKGTFDVLLSNYECLSDLLKGEDE